MVIDDTSAEHDLSRAGFGKGFPSMDEDNYKNILLYTEATIFFAKFGALDGKTCFPYTYTYNTRKDGNLGCNSLCLIQQKTLHS